MITKSSLVNTVNQLGTKFSTTWKGRGGKEGKERMQCTKEISTYYTYRDEGRLLPADSVSIMFYASIQVQEHLHRVDLPQLDAWLYMYRTIILQSKTQAASNKKAKEKAIKAAKSNMTNITNSPPCRYQTR